MARRLGVGLLFAGLTGMLPACAGTPFTRDVGPPSPGPAALTDARPYNAVTVPPAPADKTTRAAKPGPPVEPPAPVKPDPVVQPAQYAARTTADAGTGRAAIAEPASPAGKLPQALPAVELPQSRGRDVNADAPLVRILRAYLEHRPDDAMDVLRCYDRPNQEMLLYVMPMLVKLTEGSLAKAEPQDLAVLVEQLQNAMDMLQPRAALLIDKLCYCSKVYKFGHYDPLAENHAFRPGDEVNLYVQLRNVSCEPATGPGGAAGYLLRTLDRVEVRDSNNRLAWHFECPKTDPSSSPRHDYHQLVHFYLPAQMAPGTYTLTLQVTDIPTGRAAALTVDLRVSGLQ
jgi:hypothetical protein